MHSAVHKFWQWLLIPKKGGVLRLSTDSEMNSQLSFEMVGYFFEYRNSVKGDGKLSEPFGIREVIS